MGPTANLLASLRGLPSMGSALPFPIASEDLEAFSVPSLPGECGCVVASPTGVGCGDGGVPCSPRYARPCAAPAALQRTAPPWPPTKW
jgi:hypothetical protein